MDPGSLRNFDWKKKDVVYSSHFGLNVECHCEGVVSESNRSILQIWFSEAHTVNICRQGVGAES